MPAAWRRGRRGAMSHRINANVVRKWLPRYPDQSGTTLTTMLPVNVTTASVAVTRKLRTFSIPLVRR